MKNGKGMLSILLQMTPWQREDYMVNFNAADLAECHCTRCADFTEFQQELVRQAAKDHGWRLIGVDPAMPGSERCVVHEVKRGEQGLAQLLQSARNHVMTDEEKAAQVESFAFGNTHLSNPKVTREGIREAMKTLGLAVKGK